MSKAETKTAPFHWEEGDRILHAWADPAAGPGWSNSPVCVLVIDGNKQPRIEYLQPSEQTNSMVTLYSISAAAHEAMTAEVRHEASIWKRKKGKR